MKKILLITFVLALTVIGLAVMLKGNRLNIGNNIHPSQTDSYSVKNATYIIDDVPVTLTKDGATRYFGNEAKGDINGDGLPDVALIITQTSGGG